MKSLWLMLFGVVAISLKENFCVPAIRPLSQRGIIFPEDEWDNCYLDDASTRPGLCKKLEECPDILKKWDQENVYPKTCYFIKKQQFVCCPIPASDKIGNVFNTNTTTTTTLLVTEKPDNSLFDIFNTEPGIFTLSQESEASRTTTYRPSNIFLDNVHNKKPWNGGLNITTTATTTKKPSNIFLDNLEDKTTLSTDRPSNIFFDNLSTQTTSETSEKQPFDISVTDPPSFTKRRSEKECEAQNPEKLGSIDVNGAPRKRNGFPFMAILGWRSDTDNKILYSCGGILISQSFVLTAAHCADMKGASPSFVHLGDNNLTQSEEDTIKIKHLFIHPGYNKTSINNDVALVELEQEVNNTVWVCLWTQYHLPVAKFIALSYGRSNFETISPKQLLKTVIAPFDDPQSREMWKIVDKLKSSGIVESNFCTADVENSQHSCPGDTGGPLIMKLERIVYVVGITAFDLDCDELPTSIVTRVSSYIDWIEPIVWPAIDIRIDNN